MIPASGRPEMAENVVEQIEQGNWLQMTEGQSSGRFRQPMMALAAGIGAAVIVMTLPHVYLEAIVGATGLSEFVPAASPPLGNTARGLIAVMACLVSASAIYYFLNRKGDSEMGVALREQITAASEIEKKSRFGFPKIGAKSWTRFLKKPKKDKARIMDLSDLPQLHKIGRGDEADIEDANIENEVDAPARASLFAEASEAVTAPLSGDDLAFDETAPEEAMPVETVPAEILSESMDMPAEEPLIEEVPVAEAEPEVAAFDGALTDDLTDLTIAQLADRLEAGLNRLKQLEAVTDAAIKAPAAPVDEAPVMSSSPSHRAAETQENVREDLGEIVTAEREANRHADMDAALKAALGTLEKMSGQR